MARPLFLLCNDDGVHAEGIHHLARALERMGDIYIVAPHMERSAFSHALTISMPLRLQKLDPRPYCRNLFEVSGTPVDCIKIALDKLLPRLPDLIVTGINRGANLGTDILYSGTVGAAMEGLINGCKAVAVSCHGPLTDQLDYRGAVKVAEALVEERSRWFEDRPRWMLNVNIPSGDGSSLKGFRVGTPGTRLYDGGYWCKTDPRGVDYYWLGADGQRHSGEEGSDCSLLDEGFVSVSTLQATFLSGEGQKFVSSGLIPAFRKYEDGNAGS